MTSKHNTYKCGTIEHINFSAALSPIFFSGQMPSWWCEMSSRTRSRCLPIDSERMRNQRNARVCQLRKAWWWEEVHCSRMHYKRKPSWSLQQARWKTDLQDHGLHQPGSPAQRLHPPRRLRVRHRTRLQRSPY